MGNAIYKVEDYLAVMGLSVWPNLVTVGVFFLCAIEFFIGVCLALGCFRRGSAIFSLALMCVMLPLTLWIAVFNPVADCGCFGDAYIISNWATFWKNVVLFAFTLWLVRYNRYCACIITPAIQWIAFIVTALFICLIEFAGYLYQPLIDFRPFKAGSTLVEHTDNFEPEYVFTYAKMALIRISQSTTFPMKAKVGYLLTANRPQVKRPPLKQTGSIYGMATRM